jgi:precorrin-2/cobalt-factor-2 C20-methyltransferase
MNFVTIENLAVATATLKAGRCRLGCRATAGQPQPAHSRHAPTGRPEPGVDRYRKQGNRMTEQQTYGKLIGASLGPGDPELITRRAWAVLQSGARWLYPVKKAEESSYALSIVERGGIADAGRCRGTGLPDDARCRHSRQGLGTRRVRTVEPCSPRAATWSSWSKAMPPPSPPSATSPASCANWCRGRGGNHPGRFSSFAAAAAASGTTLAEEDETLAVIPAAYGVDIIDQLLDEFDTLALLKVKPLVDEVVELLEQRDLLATSVFIEKVGAPGRARGARRGQPEGREGQLPVADAGAEPQAGARRVAARLPQAQGSARIELRPKQPHTRMKIAVVSITRHGIALAGKVVAALPGAQLFAPEKFQAEAEIAAPGAATPMSARSATRCRRCSPPSMASSPSFRSAPWCA